MTYAQWVQIKINNQTTRPVTIKDLEWKSGMFFQFPEPSKEADPSTFENKEIKPKNSLSFAHRGKSDATYGCDAAIKLYTGDSKICKLYWSVPHGTGKLSELTMSEYEMENSIHVSLPPYYKNGSLGSIVISLYDKGR